MPRIAGVNIPENKHISIALTYVFGIGRPASNRILSQLSIDPQKKAKELTEHEENKIRDYIRDNMKVEGDLRRDVSSDIKRLKEIGTYRGDRHKKGLPVRGQRTKTNARTRKGPVRRVANKKMEK
ncbi:MAG: 30S ribosomal protein S13 [Patescibacteria group bacterium]|nr:30S ribosomal protein S13 [Patescibacteria group bacterium]